MSKLEIAFMTFICTFILASSLKAQEIQPNSLISNKSMILGAALIAASMRKPTDTINETVWLLEELKNRRLINENYE